jgi:hypothetical protein
MKENKIVKLIMLQRREKFLHHIIWLSSPLILYSYANEDSSFKFHKITLILQNK